MGFATVTTSTRKSSGGFGSVKKADLNSLEGLVATAEEAGYGAEAATIANPKRKLSALQRLSKGLGALNPAEAILTGTEKGAFSGIKKYATGIVKGVASAVMGTDYEGERRDFSDVAEKLGIENSIAKFGIGFLGDVFLDPSTYFGGAIARGLTKSAGVVGNTALKGVGKLIPEAERGLRIAGRGVKDALGQGFVYGYGTAKGLPARALEIEGKISKAKEGIVASNIARLGTGTLSKSQQEELVEKLLAGKRAEFGVGRGVEGSKDAARAAAQSSDPLVQKTIEEQTVRSRQFAEEAGVADPYEVYFPSLKKDKLQKFFESSKSLRVGSESYRKQFKNVLKDDELIRNPAEAFATREFEVAKDSIVRGEMKQLVGEYGKPLTAFKSEDEALKAGYTLVKEKGKFGRELGYLPEADKRLIDNLITPEFTTIDAIAKATGFDAITSLFKRSVTGLFAPFHIRNFASGIIQNFEVLGKDALNPATISQAQRIAWKLARGEDFASDVIEIGGKKLDMGKAMKAFSDRFETSSQYIADIADATKGAGNLPGQLISKESLKTTLKTAGLGQQAIPFRAARAIGNFIETQQKAAAYLAGLKQGRSIDEALALATRAGFDYRALTAFESKVLRRVIPFYSFTRKNIELQLKTLGENPERVNQVLSFFENIGDRPGEEELENLPDYIRDSLGVKLGDTPEGLKQYISNFGTPVEGFAELFKRNPVLNAISRMNPLLKAPIEIGIGKDSFRQRDLKEVYDAREYKLAPAPIKKLLNIREVTKPVFETGKDGNPKKVGTRIQYVADPVRLLVARSLFTARGFSYLDQAFGGDLEGMVKYMKLTTGLKPQQIDLKSQEFFEKRDKKRALEDMLVRGGVIKTFSNNYIPKDK